MPLTGGGLFPSPGPLRSGASARRAGQPRPLCSGGAPREERRQREAFPPGPLSPSWPWRRQSRGPATELQAGRAQVSLAALGGKEGQAVLVSWPAAALLSSLATWAWPPSSLACQGSPAWGRVPGRIRKKTGRGGGKGKKGDPEGSRQEPRIACVSSSPEPLSPCQALFQNGAWTPQCPSADPAHWGPPCGDSSHPRPAPASTQAQAATLPLPSSNRAPPLGTLRSAPWKPAAPPSPTVLCGCHGLQVPPPPALAAIWGVLFAMHHDLVGGPRMTTEMRGRHSGLLPPTEEKETDPSTLLTVLGRHWGLHPPTLREGRSGGGRGNLGGGEGLVASCLCRGRRKVLPPPASSPPSGTGGQPPPLARTTTVPRRQWGQSRGEPRRRSRTEQGLPSSPALRPPCAPSQLNRREEPFGAAQC